MARRLAFVLILLGLSFLVLPPVNAEDGTDWKESKTKVKQVGREDFTSPVYRIQSLGNVLELPGKDGEGFKVKIDGDKVLVDVKQSGTPDFKAAQGTMSKPFELTLYYKDGEKVKHSYKVLQVKGGWGIVRQSFVEATIDGKSVVLVDENCNGIYGEEDLDGLFIGGKLFGCPHSNVVLINGKLFELKVNDSATVVRYRPLTCKTGAVNLGENWGGKAQPLCTVVIGKSDFGSVAMDIPNSVVMLPEGDYRIYCSYFTDIVMNASQAKLEFVVKEGTTASPVWGKDLKMKATINYDKKNQKILCDPLPSVYGPAGEQYQGTYMDDGRFKIEVQPCSANGDPVGKGTTWSKSGGGGGG